MAVRDSRIVRMVLAVASAAILSVCPVAAQTIRFSLDGPFEGPTAPYLVAEDKGYFHQNGLTVRIEPAASALEPITRVASGTFQMGIADLNLLLRWRDQNSNGGGVKAVFIVYNRPPYAIVARKSRGLAVPKDLEGKRLGAPAASASAAQWPLFARLSEIDVAKVKVESVGIAVREPMLASGQIDAIAAYAYRAFVDLKDRGVPANDLLVWRMADAGVLGYGNAIIVSDKFAAENPEAVAGFLRAVLRGLKDTVAGPTAAVGSVIQRNELAKREVELERLRMALRENIITPEVRANGYGAVDPTRLQAAIDQQALVFKFKSKPTAAQAFDASFLPPLAERKIH